jgi:hypothetical protein
MLDCKHHFGKLSSVNYSRYWVVVPSEYYFAENYYFQKEIHIEDKSMKHQFTTSKETSYSS